MKRKRGRPRKYPQGFPLGAVTTNHPFEPLPPGEFDDTNRAQLIAMVRKRAEKGGGVMIPLQYGMAPKRPALPARHVSPDLAAWLRAAADAIETGDGLRASYYLLHALRAREVDLAAQLAELAEIGQAKLEADKKRGPKRRCKF